MSNRSSDNHADEQPDFTEGEITVMASTAFLYRLLMVNPKNYEEKLKFLAADFRHVMEVQGTPVSEERLAICMHEAFHNLELEHSVVEAARDEPRWGSDLLRYGWRIIGIGGGVTDDEAKFMNHAARVMAVDEETWYWTAAPYARMGEATMRLRAAFDVLGLPPTATFDEINASMKSVAVGDVVDGQNESVEVEGGMPTMEFMQRYEAYDYLVGNIGKRLYGIPPSREQVMPASELSICRCFFCDKATKCPPLDQLEEARCEECQALLTFEKELADTFFAMNR